MLQSIFFVRNKPTTHGKHLLHIAKTKKKGLLLQIDDLEGNTAGGRYNGQLSLEVSLKQNDE